ncbi:transcription factor IIF subunit tfg1 [Elasticomyces elasticus]|nr:transcription factor IIF subunit tfg1 [Elasticomyces elasticus]
MKAGKGNGAPFWSKETPNRDPYNGLFYRDPQQRSATPSPEREPEEDIIARKQSVSSARITKNRRAEDKRKKKRKKDKKNEAKEALKQEESNRAALEKIAKAATAHLLPKPFPVGAPTVPVLSSEPDLGIEKKVEPTNSVGDTFRDRKIPYGVLQAGVKELLRAEKVAAMTRAPNSPSFSGMVLPTLAEVKAAMPVAGINWIDLANLFAPRWYGLETEFAELMEQAGTFNIPSQMYFPTELSRREVQPFPTLEEIRKVIPADGILQRELMHIFEDRIRGRWKEFFYLVSCASVRKSGWLFAKPFSVVVWKDPVANACAQNSTTTAWSNRALSPGKELPPVLWPANAYRTAELGSGSTSSPS